MKFAFPPLFFALLASLSLAGCISLDKLPKVPLPKINVPFVGGDSAQSVEDPSMPYAANRPLTFGHTLELAAYAGSRSPEKLLGGKFMVDETGDIDLGQFGKVKVGGNKAYEALSLIRTAFLKKRGESIINIHLARIEDVPVVTVTGAVKNSGVVQWFDESNVAGLLPYVGGRSGTAQGEAVYVTRQGNRRFYANLTSASLSDLKPGDIVHFSEDL